jgi:two-component system, LuxR family, sensor kinase FixL
MKPAGAKAAGQTNLSSLTAARRGEQTDLADNGTANSLFECLPTAYLILDNRGVVLHMNNAAGLLLGCSAESLLNNPLYAYLPETDQNTLQASLTGHQDPLAPMVPVTLNFCWENGATVTIECRIYTGRTKKDADWFYLLINHSVSDNQCTDNLSATIAELQEQMQKKSGDLEESDNNLKKAIDELNYTRHQLLEREAKLNSILNASIEGIIVIDTTGVIVSVNAAVEKIFGYTAEELIGNSAKLLMPITMRKKQEYYLEKYLRIFIPKVIGQIREVEGLCKDGSLVPLDMSIAEFPLDGVQYYSGIVRDVTARKLQEQQEKEHLEKLAHVTRLGLMGEMASGIAHEVNQPLSAVVNYTQVCLRFIETETPDLPKITEVLRKANQQALKAGQIIHSMREFVKPRKIHRSTVDINELLYDAISIFEADFKQNLINMRFELTKNLPSVFIDRVQIEQVILNLIRNSIEALKDLPQFTQRQLSIETSLNEADYIVTRVKDNGPGLTPLQREKILTPFFTTKSSGMGMGLSISRSLVEAHHGTLHFNSKEDKGTTFYFTLPTERTKNGRNNEN